MSVAQSYPTLGNPMDCSLLGFSVHWILQARILEWVAIPFSRGSSQPRDQTRVSHITGRFFTIWVTRIFLILINWLSAGNLDVFFKKGFLSVWSLGKEMHLCDSSFFFFFFCNFYFIYFFFSLFFFSEFIFYFFFDSFFFF